MVRDSWREFVVDPTLTFEVAVQGILDRIKAIEDEMARTQKNKATMGHLYVR